MPHQTLTFREHVLPADCQHIREISESSGFFLAAEVDVAVELAEERLQKGEASGYYFLFAERAGRVLGYTCFGPIACTLASYDLYWIAVHQDARGQGLGRQLLEQTEAAIAARGGQRIYIETSARPQYEPTRGFYLACGYTQAALLEDFYGPGDGKLVYVKAVAPR